MESSSLTGDPPATSRPVLGPDAPPRRTARQRSQLGEAVYEELLSRLLSRKLEPGARVTIDVVARELGVSQTPVRQALGRMEVEGLVVRVPNAGYRVAPQLTRAQFEDLVELRLLLEPVAARHAAERITPERVAHLETLAARMAEPSEADEWLAYAVFARQDAELHDAIAAGGGNAAIRDALARLHTHVRLFRLRFQTRIQTEAVDEHAAVLAAIRAREPDTAAYEMRRHIERSAERFRAAFVDD